MDTPRPFYGRNGKTAGGRNENAQPWEVKMILSYRRKLLIFTRFADFSPLAGQVFWGAMDFRFQIV